MQCCTIIERHSMLFTGKRIQMCLVISLRKLISHTKFVRETQCSHSKATRRSVITHTHMARHANKSLHSVQSNHKHGWETVHTIDSFAWNRDARWSSYGRPYLSLRHRHMRLLKRLFLDISTITLGKALLCKLHATGLCLCHAQYPNPTSHTYTTKPNYTSGCLHHKMPFKILHHTTTCSTSSRNHDSLYSSFVHRVDHYLWTQVSDWLLTRW